MHEIAAAAAVLGRKRHPQNPRLRRLAVELARKAFGFLPLARERRDLFTRETQAALPVDLVRLVEQHYWRTVGFVKRGGGVQPSVQLGGLAAHAVPVSLKQTRSGREIPTLRARSAPRAATHTQFPS